MVPQGGRRGVEGSSPLLGRLHRRVIAPKDVLHDIYRTACVVERRQKQRRLQDEEHHQEPDDSTDID